MKLEKARLLYLVLGALLATAIVSAQSLEIRGKYVYKEPKNPLFWCGDVNWELIHHLTREEIVAYLDDRAAKGFNVIQTAALTRGDVVRNPNAYGDLPFSSTSGASPLVTQGRKTDDSEAYDYWDHVDWAIQEIKNHGLLVCIVPMWASDVGALNGDDLIHDPSQAYAYGFWLGKRLALYNKNIIWMFGGDSNPDASLNGLEIWRAMAEGVADGVKGDEGFDGIADYASTTMTYGCRQSSALWFQTEEWIDFNTWGTSVGSQNESASYTIARFEHMADVIKPSINCQPIAEMDEYFDPTSETGSGTYNAWHVRRTAYWSVFSGACGFSYTCKPVSQCAITTQVNATDWKKALNAPGAGQMQFLKNLMRSRTFHSGNSSQKLLAANPPDADGYLAATLGEGYAMIYTPTGKKFAVDFKELPFTGVKAWWYDPRIGIALDANASAVSEKVFQFDPPGEERPGNDWVLVLDDMSRNLDAPGIVNQ